MQGSPTSVPADPMNTLDSPEKSSFILASQGTLEIIELMGAADRLKSAGLKDQTISLYRLWLEHTTSPLAYVGYFNLGVELASEREYIQAEAMYRKALEQSPEFIRARLNLGNCLEQQKRDDEALEQWRLALMTESILLPENLSLQLHALNNLGRLLEMKKNYKDSLARLEESFALDPTQRDVLLHLVHLIQKICRWPVFAPPKGITKEEMISGTSPLAMLAASDDPKLQLSAAQQFIEHKYPLTSPDSLAPKHRYNHEKIRIGYLSSDFCLHAVSLLMVELLELHDHSRFEVYGFCWSRVDDTSIQKRVHKSLDHYIRIAEMSDKEAADCIRSHEIDIIVDLQGLTSGARPLILSYRPASLQITYLGFPGTTGLPWIDYVIADKYLIPDELAPFHTEKPLYMPNCFQSSDSKREVGLLPTRADNGLPEKAFVFCSFNNNYKFTPEMFATWMRILKRVPGSVMWLLADNEWSHENLLATAKKMGVKKERLVFAPRVAPADYLARYQLADLFLDTFPFNGGTTANDALFMGLPLLTLSGRTFASRMAGSLLTNLELPELIATNLKEYEEKAVRFAKKTAELKILKNRLKENKTSGPVFDMPRFVKGYENSLASLLDKTETLQPELNNTGSIVKNLDIIKKKVLNVGGNSKTISIPACFDGWQHDLLDIDPTGKPDILCDARELNTLAPGQYEAIYCSHNLEHYYYHDVSSVLKGFYSILKNDGLAYIKVPDMMAVMKKVIQDNIELDGELYMSGLGPIAPLDVFYGYRKQIESSGVDFFAHKMGFSVNVLAKLLVAAGFTVIYPICSNLDITVFAFKEKPNAEIATLLNLKLN